MASRPRRKPQAAPAALDLWDTPTWLQEVADDPGYEWARKAWEKAKSYPNSWFDAEKAEAVVRAWPTWFRLTEDRFAGKPFRLNTWQAICVRLLVGWKIPTEILDETTGLPRVVWVRLFRRLLLWIPRKNGKSEFLAALSLLFWVIDAVMRGQGFVFARKEEQAAIIFDKMKAMIGYSADLAADTIPYRKSIYLKTAASPFTLLPGSEEGTHGKSPTVITGDEMHEWKSLTIATNLRQGAATRLQPIELYASTAGLKTNHVGYGLWEESLAILDGRINDPRSLPVIFAADASADWKDPKIWRQANPSLGLSPTVDHLEREADLARDNPRQEAYFRRYHLNQWVDATVRWIPEAKWDACASSAEGWKHYPETLKGRTCYGAFDISATQDITALVLVFPPEGDDPKWRVMGRFWVPELTLDKRVKVDRVPYDHWVKVHDVTGRAALETTPGDYVDQNYVLRAIQDANELYDVQRWGYDPWNASKLIADAENNGMDPALFLPMRQGIPTLGEPSRHFERLTFSGALDHGGNPVLRWMVLNMVVRSDANMNFAPTKSKSAEKIDGGISTVMGVGLACVDVPDTESYVENSDLLLI